MILPTFTKLGLHYASTGAETAARNRVAESAAQRAAEALRQPEVWAMAERISKGGHVSPRTAAAVYRELIWAYNLGVHHTLTTGQRV